MKTIQTMLVQGKQIPCDRGSIVLFENGGLGQVAEVYCRSYPAQIQGIADDIVRAVNNHEALVKALEGVLSAAQDGISYRSLALKGHKDAAILERLRDLIAQDTAALDQARAALAQAKGA